MGTPTDMMTRQTKLRVNDEARKKKIRRARRLIFKHGASINGNRIKEILQSQSFVPTRVCDDFKFPQRPNTKLTIF